MENSRKLMAKGKIPTIMINFVMAELKVQEYLDR